MNLNFLITCTFFGPCTNTEKCSSIWTRRNRIPLDPTIRKYIPAMDIISRPVFKDEMRYLPEAILNKFQLTQTDSACGDPHCSSCATTFCTPLKLTELVDHPLLPNLLGMINRVGLVSLFADISLLPDDFSFDIIGMQNIRDASDNDHSVFIMHNILKPFITDLKGCILVPVDKVSEMISEDNANSSFLLQVLKWIEEGRLEDLSLQPII